MSEHTLAHEVTRIDVEPDPADPDIPDGWVAYAAMEAIHDTVTAIDGPDGEVAGVVAEQTVLRSQRYVPADSPRLARLRMEAEQGDAE